MGRLNQKTSRCRQLLLLPSCSSSWWGHKPGHRIGPLVGHSVGHSKTAKGASATKTTQGEAVEEAVGLRTAWGPSVTRTTVVVAVEVSVIPLDLLQQPCSKLPGKPVQPEQRRRRFWRIWRISIWEIVDFFCDTKLPAKPVQTKIP